VKRLALVCALLAAIGAACLNGSSHPASRPRVAVSPVVPPPRTYVILRLRRTWAKGAPPLRAGIRCNGDATGGPWSILCGAIERRAEFYSNAHVNPICHGGLPPTEMRVDGEIEGRPVHLRQSGMCGPPGIWAWYQLLAAERRRLPSRVLAFV